MTDTMFLWAGWEPAARILLIAACGYIWLVFLLRNAGPRTVATMTTFDFVITVTLGSAFGRVLTATEVALFDVLVVFTALVALQWAFSIARFRSPAFSRLVDSGPSLLYYRGRPVADAMRRHRLTEADLHSAVRQSGMGSLERAEAVVLQADGSFAVIGTDDVGDGSAVASLVRA